MGAAPPPLSRPRGPQTPDTNRSKTVGLWTQNLLSPNLDGLDPQKKTETDPCVVFGHWFCITFLMGQGKPHTPRTLVPSQNFNARGWEGVRAAFGPWPIASGGRGHESNDTHHNTPIGGGTEGCRAAVMNAVHVVFIASHAPPAARDRSPNPLSRTSGKKSVNHGNENGDR